MSSFHSTALWISLNEDLYFYLNENFRTDFFNQFLRKFKSNLNKIIFFEFTEIHGSMANIKLATS